MSDEKKINRRQFMSWVTGAISALIGLGLGIPARVTVSEASRRRIAQSFSEVGGRRCVLGA